MANALTITELTPPRGFAPGDFSNVHSSLVQTGGLLAAFFVGKDLNARKVNQVLTRPP